jgi:hemerythrin superfamily protein
MPTVIEILTSDHRAIERLFDEFEDARTNEIALRLGDALVLHAAVEEALLYPFVRAMFIAGDRLSDEAEDDHEKVKEFVAEAEDTRGAALDELVAELRVDVEDHVRWEEDDLFPLLAATVDADTLCRLAERVMEFKRSQPVA